jgi:copper transport protein
MYGIRRTGLMQHAFLLRSVPPHSAILSVPPDQVRIWLSEALNPAFSTAVVVNAASQRVDDQDAQLALDDASKMDVTLHPNLAPRVYTVVWRADSNDDGHVLSGSLHFTVANRDGTVIPSACIRVNLMLQHSLTSS